MRRALTVATAAGALLVAGVTGGQAAHASAEKSVGTVNYVKNYGPAFWKKSGNKLVPLGKTLKTGTTWKVFDMEKYGKDYLFNMGGNQMANSRYLDLYKENSSQSLKAVAKIHYTPGYGIAVWNQPNGKPLSKKLKHGTSWKTFGRKVVNGHVWYNLGGNQWFDSTYANLTKETSRGVKTYAKGAPQLIKPTVQAKSTVKVTMSASAIAGYKKAAQNGEGNLKALNKQVNFKFVAGAADKNSKLGANKQLSAAQTQSVSVFTATLMNQVRGLLGVPALKVSTSSAKAATLMTNHVNKKNIDMFKVGDLKVRNEPSMMPSFVSANLPAQFQAGTKYALNMFDIWDFAPWRNDTVKNVADVKSAIVAAVDWMLQNDSYFGPLVGQSVQEVGCIDQYIGTSVDKIGTIHFLIIGNYSKSAMQKQGVNKERIDSLMLPAKFSANQLAIPAN